MVSASVRTAGSPQVQRRPSTTSCRTCERPAVRPCTGSRMRETSSALSATRTASVTNGQAVPATKRVAPTAGPTISFMTSVPVISRALPTPRSARPTTIGSRVPEVVSAKTSATPRTKSAARTAPRPTSPVSRAVARTTRTPLRARSTPMTSRRRSTRSARTPACRPKSSHGSRYTRAPRATRNGSWVWPATSSGPAARAMPSPRLPTQDDPTSQQNGFPIRAASTASTSPRTARTVGTASDARPLDSQDARLPHVPRGTRGGRASSVGRSGGGGQGWSGALGSGADLGAVGSPGAPSPVRSSFDPEAVVHLGVVPLAQQRGVVQIGRPTLDPGQQVVDVAPPGGRAAAGEHTAAVAHLRGAAHVGREQPHRAAVVQRHPVGAHHDPGDSLVAGQPAGPRGGDRGPEPHVARAAADTGIDQVLDADRDDDLRLAPAQRGQG